MFKIPKPHDRLLLVVQSHPKCPSDYVYVKNITNKELESTYSKDVYQTSSLVRDNDGRLLESDIYLALFVKQEFLLKRGYSFFLVEYL